MTTRTPRVGEVWRPGPDATWPEGYELHKVSRGQFEWWAWCAPGERPPGPRDSFPADRRAQSKPKAIAAMWTHFGALPEGVAVTMVGSANAWVAARGQTKVVSIRDMRAGWFRVDE